MAIKQVLLALFYKLVMEKLYKLSSPLYSYK